MENKSCPFKLPLRLNMFNPALAVSADGKVEITVSTNSTDGDKVDSRAIMGYIIEALNVFSTLQDPPVHHYTPVSIPPQTAGQYLTLVNSAKTILEWHSEYGWCADVNKQPSHYWMPVAQSPQSPPQAPSTAQYAASTEVVNIVGENIVGENIVGENIVDDLEAFIALYAVAPSADCFDWPARMQEIRAEIRVSLYENLLRHPPARNEKLP